MGDGSCGSIWRGTDGKSHRVSYAHWVARALLKTTHDIRGYTCNLHYIAPGDWYRYEADHDVHGDQCDCRLGAINVSDP